MGKVAEDIAAYTRRFGSLEKEGALDLSADKHTFMNLLRIINKWKYLIKEAGLQDILDKKPQNTQDEISAAIWVINVSTQKYLLQ